MLDKLIGLFRKSSAEDMHYYRLIRRVFGIKPSNIELYKLALVHKSASVVLEEGGSVNNERLEFLGDAVIETVVSEMLFVEYPEKNEGALTQLRSRIVSRTTLNQLATDLGLNIEIIAHPTSVNTHKQNIYGDAFEALVGAMYLDKGYECVNKVLITKIFHDYIDIESLTTTESDFKSRIIEWSQKSHRKLEFISSESSEHTDVTPSFQTYINVDGAQVSFGVGRSKKEAEQRAAQKAYLELTK